LLTKPYGVISQHIGVSWCISTYRVYIYTHCKYIYIHIVNIYIYIIIYIYILHTHIYIHIYIYTYIYIYTVNRYLSIYIYLYIYIIYIYIYMNMILKLFTMANLQIGRHSAFCPKAKGRSSTCCIPQGRRHCSGHPIFTQTLCKEKKCMLIPNPLISGIYIYICIVYIHSIVFIIFPA